MMPFTLVMAYYENAGMLREHVKLWFRLPPEILSHLSVIVVDDGSPTAPAADAISPMQLHALQGRLADFQLWRMGVDVPWNQDACRNVGVREARTTWILLTDMDHVVPEDTWRNLMNFRLKKQRAYRFSRINAPKFDTYKPHPNSWALTQGLYWQAGGYDEALAGNYGTDGDFLVRLSHVAEQVQYLEWPLIRYPREVIPDASTTTLERKNPEERQRINALVKGRTGNPDWKPLHFSFPCARVF